MKWRKKRDLILRRWLAVLCALALLAAVAFFRCRPVVAAFAESHAVWLSTDIANRQVAAVLEDKADLCRSMIAVAYNNEKILSSVVTDTAAINAIRTEATNRIMAAMDGLTTIQVGIPLGTLAGWDWCSGWGPVISVPLSVTCTVVSDVSSKLEAAGMNQTHYRVILDMTVQTYVVTPSGRSSVAVDVSFPMAETVLLGDVPENLTEVYGDDQTVLGKIFDYGTVE